MCCGSCRRWRSPTSLLFEALRRSPRRVPHPLNPYRQRLSEGAHNDHHDRTAAGQQPQTHHWNCSTPTGCLMTTSATSPPRCASSSTPDFEAQRRGVVRIGYSAKGTGKGVRRLWACWACTWTATAARAPTPSATGWPAWSWKPATAGSAASCRCRARCRCSRSTATAPRSRRASGCRDWPPARPSAASA